MRAMRALIVIAAMIEVSPALADTVTCSMWQQITTCVRPDGYVSHEITWKGIMKPIRELMQIPCEGTEASNGVVRTGRIDGCHMHL